MKNFLLFSLMSLLHLCLHAQTTISSSVSIVQDDIDNYSWPVVINGGTLSNPVVVTLAEDIRFQGNDHYFIIESDYITFNGNNKNITIEQVPEYPGLLQNGDENNAGYPNISISNTNVLSVSSTLAENGGWIGQIYFGVNAEEVFFENCYSNGNMFRSSGGIAGRYSECVVTNSHSSGAIGFESGGIFGVAADGTAINCYSTGDMEDYAGGIFGYYTRGFATDCYSTGYIGYQCGGILGYYSFVTASNCYSTGFITNQAGGVTSRYFQGSVMNCYSAGSIQSGGEGITAWGNGGSVNNCYAANGNWLDATANSILTGVGSTWKEISTNQPYLLSSFNETIYSPDNTSVPANSSSDFYAGNFSTGAYSFIRILGNAAGVPKFSIDAGSGLISVTNAVTGSYTLEILYTDDIDGSYQISDFDVLVMSVLPISWQAFTVTPKANSAWLQWSTASEQHTRDYTVEHSTNGLNWFSLATIAAAGNSTVIKNYSYLHTNPVNGDNYYRIQQTDIDGKYSYSAVRHLQLALKNKSFSVLNTIVVNNVLQVDMKISSTLYLYTGEGKLIWQKKSGTGLQNINMSNVPAGVYLLKSKDAVERIVVR